MTTTTRRRRGTGTLEILRDGRLRTRLTTRSGRRSLGIVGTREEGDAILAAARTELLEASYAPALTLRAWGTRFPDRLEQEGIRGIATERSRWAVHIDRSPLADMPLASIARREVIDWLDNLCAKRAADKRGHRRLSKQTVQNTLNLLRTAFKAARARGMIASNPAEEVDVPIRIAATEEPWTYLLLHEQHAIMKCAAIPLHDRLMMKFAIGTGLREGEQFNLQIRDVRVTGEHPEVTVRYGSKGKGTKNAKIRRVPLFGMGFEAAREWLGLLTSYAPSNPQELMFPGRTGARRQRGKHLHVTRRVDGKPRPINPLPEYLASAGIVLEHRHDRRPVRWHDLRHTCAASLVSGMWGRRWSLEEVKGLLGHSSVTVTERYAHLADSALRTAAAETLHKPAVSPRRSRNASRKNGVTIGYPSWSHLRDLNSRPTVYETVALPLS